MPRRTATSGADRYGVPVASRSRHPTPRPTRRHDHRPGLRRKSMAALIDLVRTADIPRDSNVLYAHRRVAVLPDGALLVNVARGPVVDTTALLGELSSGRPRAALGVTGPDSPANPSPTCRTLNRARARRRTRRPTNLTTAHAGGRRECETCRRTLQRRATAGRRDGAPSPSRWPWN
ncbi:NAD(P)-dependent oxidoreductase [Plantactinospora sp. WMMB334]|uniref:NAD(P)-dependent oxidoreductase n=1 Tax=Plantactinospora sp. WMMB334 TaxID=3404119 RepID=UPI003B92487C